MAITSGCFVWLMMFHRKIGLSMHAHRHGEGQSSFFDLHIQGMFICYLLAAVLVVLFVTQINRNLRDRDAALADLRQQSVEEDTSSAWGFWRLELRTNLEPRSRRSQ